MLRWFAICLFTVIHSWSIAATMNDINVIRVVFNEAIEDGEKAKVLFEKLSELKPANNTLQFAYLGATEALLAKHSYNPFSKLTYVNSALNKLNQSVALNENNIEIRYMRFSVEANMPAYLGYSKHIDADKSIILKGLSSSPIKADNCEMYKVFANGILQSKYCNKEEKQLLLKVVATCNQVKQNKN